MGASPILYLLFYLDNAPSLLVTVPDATRGITSKSVRVVGDDISSVLVLTKRMKTGVIKTWEQTRKASRLLNDAGRKCDFFSVMLLFLAMSRPCHASEPQAMTNDFVSFFKQMISSPPDVDNFKGRSHAYLKHGPDKLLEFYEGARAGSNFFLTLYPDALEMSNGQSHALFVLGRAGSSPYEFSANSVTRSIGSSILQTNVSLLYRETSRFLNMGITVHDPQSVVWTGNNFTATAGNERIRGELVVSNNLPSKLILSWKTNKVYRMVEYTYPSPPASLQGFPSKMLEFGPSNSVLVPKGETELFFVHLSEQPLSNDFFRDARFIGTNITHTNIYSNNVLYVSSKKGTMVRAVINRSPSAAHRDGHRLIVFAAILVLFVVGAIFTIVLGIRKNPIQQKNQ